MQPQRARGALSNVLRRIDPDDRLRAYRLWSFWSDEVGPAIAGHAQPISLRAGVLTVSVDAPTWLQELQFLKDTLRQRLNTRLGQPLIDDLHFVSGPVPRRPARGRNTPAVGPLPDAIPPLRNPELAAAFARIVAARARRARRDE